MVAPERGHLVVRRLEMMGFALYGPPEGTPTSRHVTWRDMASLGTPLAWSMAFGAKESGRFAVNTLAAQMAAVRAGIGVAVLPHFLARDAGLRLLTDTLPQGVRWSGRCCW